MTVKDIVKQILQEVASRSLDFREIRARFNSFPDYYYHYPADITIRKALVGLIKDGVVENLLHEYRYIGPTHTDTIN